MTDNISQADTSAEYRDCQEAVDDAISARRIQAGSLSYTNIPGPTGQPLLQWDHSGPSLSLNHPFTSPGAMTEEQRQLHYRRLRTSRMRQSVDRINTFLALEMDLRGVEEELAHLDLAIVCWRQEIEAAADGGAA